MSKARNKGTYDVYHVMWRAINKETIFEDDGDFKLLIGAIKYSKKLLEYDLIAYCIMGNHIHLMVKEGKDNVSKVMQVIGSVFVRHYNERHGRLGPLFHSRFKSEPIETKNYFICCIRYICMNPVKAGIVAKAKDYKYSSYQEMVDIKLGQLINKELIKQVISIDCMISLCEMEYNNEKDFIEVDYDEKNSVENIEKILRNIGYNQHEDIDNLTEKNKAELLNNLWKSGVSKNKISNYFGITKHCVDKYIKLNQAQKSEAVPGTID